MLLNKNQTIRIDKGKRPSWQKKVSAAPAKLGDCIQQFMIDTVEPKTEQYQTICQIWEKIVPENLRHHCRIIETENGIVKVQADSSSFLFELRLNSQQMLRQIQNEDKSLRIKNLKFVVGRRTKDGCS